ncbi:SBDS protein C-terminal domain-containing protein [Lasiosphaeria miniovina]|uniref:Ribosome maturation protein SDO1 n=1 Tax=Lasiosphaeria miniovina TaxID=1954250 RepID=A0AA40AVM4_9PEZI|nr:SBDS protein C-terminal domain-containing protein [Lasiosphaeria miniovina]KAK0722774.1 SBDS protein C-terminal domain-containing protein [Lasiosphaeria miniovina]
MVIQQPSNQIKLTNVSLVRLKKGKKRFEIACYKNKVLEWRSGIETDLDNVLQIPNVFLNVSKGQTAPKEDLVKAFGKASTDDIVLEILRKGELQVGEKERTAQLERVHHEVVGIVASKLVDPRTKRVYTTGMIEKALDMLSSQAHALRLESHKDAKDVKDKDKETAAAAPTPAPPAADEAPAEATEEAAAATSPTDDSKNDDEAKPARPAKDQHHLWTGVVTIKSAKSQALEAMKALIAYQPIPVARARMKLRIGVPTHVLKQSLKSHKASPEDASGAGGGGDGEQKVARTVKDKILSFIEQVEHQDVVGSEWEVVGFAEPGAFKGLSDFIGGETKGQGRIEVLDMDVTQTDD